MLNSLPENESKTPVVIKRSVLVKGTVSGMVLSLCLSSGCAGLYSNRPFTMMPVQPVLPQSEVITNPTEVTPRSNRNTGKPVLQGIEELEADPVEAEPEANPSLQTFPKGESEFLPSQKFEPSEESDAPVWKPLQAPQQDESASYDPTQTILGEPQKFPVTRQSPTVANSVAPQDEKLKQQSPEHILQPVSRTGQLWDSEVVSTGNRAIETISVGTGPHRILILGSIYGNEPQSIRLIDEFAKDLRQARLPKGYSLTLVRTPNPDGYAEAMRTNLNGVDLNRNFPSTWFTANPNRLTGPHAGSEVETQYMLRLLKDRQPTRVIHVHDGIGHRPLVILNQKWAGGVQIESLVKNVDSGTFDGAYKIGSIEEFASIRLSSEMAAIQLPPQGFQQLSSAELMQIALQGVSADNVLPRSSPLAGQTDLPPVKDNSLKPDGQKGFVQLLPPPPGTERINQASNTQLVGDDHRYYELPPPPHSR